MRTSTAYFAGAGTVVAAVVAGLGGGLLIANIVSPHPLRQEMTRVERNRSAEPIPVSRAPSEPVPYLAATEAAATKPVVVAPAPDRAQPQPGQPQTEAANNSPAAAQSAEATDKHEAPAVQASTSPQSPAPAAQSAAREQGASPDNALARARDVDVRRTSTDKRRSERRQQWAEKRRYPRDQELRDVEQKVRQETEPTQAFAPEPVRVEMPRIRFFDSE